MSRFESVFACLLAGTLAACEAKPTNELLRLQIADAEVNTNGFCRMQHL